MLASAAFGGDWFGLRTSLTGRESPEPRAPATSRDLADRPTSTPTRTATTPSATPVRSQPWWQDLGTFAGSGDDGSPQVTVAENAIQWRVRWSCTTGRLVVDAGRDEPLVDAVCPGEDIAYATTTGPAALGVMADGTWTLEVEQQVDVPLVEPPLPEMVAPGASVLSEGGFFDIDQVGRGTMTVYRLEDGSHAVRLEDFFVTPNIDLELRFSALERPTSTEEFAANPHEFVAPLDVTAGAMNFLVPPEVDPGAWASLVVWCPPLHRAYAGATMTAP